MEDGADGSQFVLEEEVANPLRKDGNTRHHTDGEDDTQQGQQSKAGPTDETAQRKAEKGET